MMPMNILLAHFGHAPHGFTILAVAGLLFIVALVAVLLLGEFGGGKKP